MVCKPTTTGQKYAESFLRSNSPVFNVTFTDILRRETNPVERFDRTKIVNITSSLNRTLEKVILDSYPFLGSRVTQGPIPYTEVADFLVQTGFGITSVENDIKRFETYINTLAVNEATGEALRYDPASPNPSESVPDYYENILNQLETYYSENIANTISGGFCAAFSNPFNQILETVASIQLGVDLLSTLRNFNVSDLFDQLDLLKNKILTIVDELVASLRGQLEGIIDRITSINAKGLFRMVHRQINSISSFFDNFSVDSMKKEIERFINDTVSQFEELTPETIALLMFRFCQFSELIQSFLKTPLVIINNQVETYAQQYEILQRRGYEQTSQVVNRGAPRISPSGVSQGRADQYAASTPTDTMNQPAIFNPELEDYENRAISNLTDNGFPGYFRFGPGVTQMHDRRGVKSAYPGAGYKEVKREVWEKLTVVARELGRELLINSAYRSPEYNAALNGSASRSRHMSGEAIDVSVDGLSDDEIRKFIAISSGIGFGGIGGYGGSNPYMIHVDLSGRRIWGANNSRSSVPAFKFASDLYRHERNEFVNIRSTAADPIANVYEESDTALLRSTQRGEERRAAFERISEVEGSNKVILRSE